MNDKYRKFFFGGGGFETRQAHSQQHQQFTSVHETQSFALCHPGSASPRGAPIQWRYTFWRCQQRWAICLLIPNLVTLTWPCDRWVQSFLSATHQHYPDVIQLQPITSWCIQYAILKWMDNGKKHWRAGSYFLTQGRPDSKHRTLYSSFFFQLLRNSTVFTFIY